MGCLYICVYIGKHSTEKFYNYSALVLLCSRKKSKNFEEDQEEALDAFQGIPVCLATFGHDEKGRVLVIKVIPMHPTNTHS